MIKNTVFYINQVLESLLLPNVHCGFPVVLFRLGFFPVLVVRMKPQMDKNKASLSVPNLILSAHLIQQLICASLTKAANFFSFTNEHGELFIFFKTKLTGAQRPFAQAGPTRIMRLSSADESRN